MTHSNQALNQLFEKIMALDIDERHLLRLGHGEEALETEKDFSRYGRVNYVLSKRMELLERVDQLQASLGVQGKYRDSTFITFFWDGPFKYKKLIWPKDFFRLVWYTWSISSFFKRVTLSCFIV